MISNIAERLRNRTPSALKLRAIAIVILVGQILIVQFGGSVFRTVPLFLTDWIAITVLTSVVLWVGELGRLFKCNQKAK